MFGRVKSSIATTRATATSTSRTRIGASTTATSVGLRRFVSVNKLEAAKVVDAKMPRGLDAWSVSGMEYVGRGTYPAVMICYQINDGGIGIPPYFC